MEYVYVLPIAVVIAFLANSSGFSGGVLFQPFFYFFLRAPMAGSIATGSATETIGMLSGTARYVFLKQIDWALYVKKIPFILAGVALGVYLFGKIDTTVFLAILVVVLTLVGLAAIFERDGFAPWLALGRIGRPSGAFGSGLFSALTGTGVCELMQAELSRDRKRSLISTNATAIALEATANVVIFAGHVLASRVRYDILIWSGLGVLIGGQIGASTAHRLPISAMRRVFGVCLCILAIYYLYRIGLTLN